MLTENPHDHRPRSFLETIAGFRGGKAKTELDAKAAKADQLQTEIEQAETEIYKLAVEWNDEKERLRGLGIQVAGMEEKLQKSRASRAKLFEELVNRGGGEFGSFDEAGLAGALANIDASFSVMDKAIACIKERRSQAVESLREFARKHNIPRPEWPAELSAKV